MHLDLYTEDQAAEVARLEALGATLVRHSDDPGDDYAGCAIPRGTSSACA